MRFSVNLTAGPAMLMIPMAGRPGHWTGAANAVIPGANTSLIVA
jgi:hypothetical protein